MIMFCLVLLEQKYSFFNYFIDLPLIKISTNASKYTLSGTELQFTCATALQSFRDLEGMELVKDGIPFYQPIVRYSRYYSTARFGARKNDTGKYQCKGIIGTASRYSSPFFLIVGSKYKVLIT